MNFRAHAFTERGVHELMLLYTGLSAKRGAYDDRFKVVPVAFYFQVIAGEPIRNPVPDLLGIDQFSARSAGQ